MLIALAFIGIIVVKLTEAEDLVSVCNPVNSTIYNFSVQRLDGQNESMSMYAGKALIIVNVATYCKFTEQYNDFNPLLEKYEKEFNEKQNKAAVYMAAFPCNQFHLQEPAENDEILNGIKYVRPGRGYEPHPNLHIYGKLEVNGDNAHPLYTYLKDACPTATKVLGLREYMFWDNIRVNDVSWNFEKFVINTRGQPIYRIHPATWNGGTVMDKFLNPIVRKTI